MSQSDLESRVKAMELEQKHILKYQDNSYRWSLEVSTNLKALTTSIRRLTVSIKDLQSQISVLEENGMVFPSSHTQDTVTKQPKHQDHQIPAHKPATQQQSLPKRRRQVTFHQEILQMEASGRHDLLRQCLLSITSDQFDSLNETSLAVVLPHVVSFLDDRDPNKQVIALVYLFEMMQKCPIVFGFSNTKASSQHALSILQRAREQDRLADMASSAVKVEEISQLIRFLRSVF
eukprot:gnl/Dysnectes_brevis/7592_a12877_318.p1 GENE.gnl/Dysnectes_brevis/7592_a12877_318~~gnl/Dysnectes_brevis/7592_a12877_318.p1  ORF type:complete len:233 (+),score=32.20 gnl/Dysnectes_brevis/7592_a12877_318:87-785(+)